jgi:uncharacterized protein YciI
VKLFAVIRTRGNDWDQSLRLEQQPDWGGHALFMDGLASEGFIVMGGPLEDTRDVLLIVRAASEEEIAERLQDDPWAKSGLLRIRQISPRTLRLGSLPEASG